MGDLWSTDVRVLDAIARQVEVDRRRSPDLDAIFGALDLDAQQGRRSVGRLVEAGMLRVDGGRAGGGGLGGLWVVSAVTEYGLRAVGAWPDDATRLAEQIIAALAETAEREPELLRGRGSRHPRR